MKDNLSKFQSFIAIFCGIFGAIGFIIAILAAENDIIKGICAAFLFLIGWTAAKLHGEL